MARFEQVREGYGDALIARQRAAAAATDANKKMQDAMRYFAGALKERGQ